MPDLPKEAVEAAGTGHSWKPLTQYQRNLRDAASIKRIARELREMLADAPADDSEVAEILADCKALDRAVQLLSTRPIETGGSHVPSA